MASLTVAEALALAVQQHRDGQLAQAEQLYRAILQADPRHAEAHYLAGLAAFGLGRPGEAADALGEALRLRPDFAEAYLNLGLVRQAQGRPDQEADCYRQALRCRPDYAEAHTNLGLALQEQGQLEEALACHREAVRLRPELAEAHNNLGQALHQLGRAAAALASFGEALRRRPGYAEGHDNRGVALQGQGRLEEALACHREAVRLRPGLAAAHNNLGSALHQLGRLEEAQASLQGALRLKPDYAEAHYNLGVVFQAQGRLAEALACYQQALRFKPDYAEAHTNLGAILQEQGDQTAALACYQQALRCKPDFVVALNNLSVARQARGELGEAVAGFQEVLRLKPDFAVAHSGLLFALQYRPGVTLRELAEAHAEYDRRHAAPLRAAWRPHANDRDPDRPLRLGFLSPDLGRHPVGYYLIRALEHLDPQQAAVVCYSNRFNQDELTARFRTVAAAWHDVACWNDERLAEQIRADGIDLLFDLAGHTDRNRLLVFARKPAPLQLTWLGYEGTTGLAAIDYLLADRHMIPPGAEAPYRERVLRLPDGYVCYEPPAFAPPVGPLPAREPGAVTFGSFNNPAKLNADVIALWARLLARLPRARLVLKYRGLDDPAVAGRLAGRFAGHGVDPSRVEFRGWSAHAEMLGEYGGLDLALDPFPFNGGATTCEALWMGVPVVTWPGETFAGRHSLSHLSNVGLTETIARDPDEYVELAAALAEDLPRLAALRVGLRERMAGSPLCDGPRFAANLMQLLRQVWRRWALQGA